MKFFVDNNLGRQLADGMRGFGENMMHLLDEFPQDANDAEWLEYVGKNGLTLITRDKRIRWRPAELCALRTHKVGAFVLGGKNQTRCQLIQQLVRNWPQIKELAGKTKPPFAFQLPATGTKIRSITLS